MCLLSPTSNNDMPFIKHLRSLQDPKTTQVIALDQAAQLAHTEVVDRWHCRLDHARRDRVRELMRNGELLSIPDMPIFDALVCGKQSREIIAGSICQSPGSIES
jgi:hypothetical protein